MQTFEVEIKLIVHAQRAGDAASPAERRSVNGPLRVPPKVLSTGKRVDIRQLSPGCWPRAKRDQTLPDATITQAQSL